MKKSQKIIYILIELLIIILVLLFSNNNLDNTTSNYAKLTIWELPQDFAIADESNLQIIYFDVGNADCILIKDDKDIILIDSGNDEDGKYIVEYLKELGISKINYLVGTHEHEDHIGGMNYIVDNFDIQDIYLTRTDSSKENVEYNELLQTIANKNCTYEEPNTNTKFILGDSTFIIRYVSNIESNPNNDSIVIELENENLKYLFTGDIEQKIEKTVAWDSIDVLKVAHHGSDTSTSQDFLNVIFSEKNKLREKITVISTGNRENLLDDIVLQRLHAIPNNKIYITRNDGSIYITNIDGKNSVKTLRTKVDSTQH